jgi:hypothetical protein
LWLTKNVKGGRSPLRAPMRPLHRLETGTPHTIRHLGSCPIIAVVGGSAPKAGHARRRKSASVPASFLDWSCFQFTGGMARRKPASLRRGEEQGGREGRKG